MAAQGQSKICPKCLEVNDHAATFCIECGAPLSDEPGAEGSDQEVYRDITQANLHRIRGDYKQAVDTCLSILRRFPNNGTAHTLLGDIYAEQGELDQSIQWYEMALDLRPESENDRRKLNVVSKRKTDQEAASTAKQLGIPETKPRSQQMVFVSAILVAVVGTASFFIGGALNKKNEPAPKPKITAPIDVGSLIGKSPMIEPDAVSDDAPTEGSSPVTPSSFGTRTEQEVKDLLASEAGLAGRVMAVYEDPRTYEVLVTVASAEGESPKETSTKVFKAIFKSFPGYVQVTVKVVEGGRTVFIGDANLAAYRAAIEEGKEPDSALVNVWPIESE